MFRFFKYFQILKHQDFDEKNLLNDIAIIHLHDFIESTPSTQYACLPTHAISKLQSNKYPSPNQFGFIVGWGKIAESELDFLIHEYMLSYYIYLYLLKKKKYQLF